MTNRPLVSVVVPAFNAERFLPDALSSIAAQTYEHVETMVVDDGSTDDTAAVARSFEGVRCIQQPHAGVAAARNKGVASTGGDVVAFLDSDDCWPPTKLARQVDHLLRQRTIGIVLGRQQVFHDDVDATSATETVPAWFASEGEGPGLVAYATMALWRHVFETVGPFDETRTTSEDTEWLIRARDAGIQLAILDGVVLHRRFHRGNLTSRTAIVRRDLATILHDRMRRRRDA